MAIHIRKEPSTSRVILSRITPVVIKVILLKYHSSSTGCCAWTRYLCTIAEVTCKLQSVVILPQQTGKELQMLWTRVLKNVSICQLLLSYWKLPSDTVLGTPSTLLSGLCECSTHGGTSKLINLRIKLIELAFSLIKKLGQSWILVQVYHHSWDNSWYSVIGEYLLPSSF